MDAREKRARELLANQVEAVPGYSLSAKKIRDGVALNGPMLQATLSAIVAALTPPEGCVAAPEDPSLAMTAAGQLFGLTANQACAVYQSMLAARPEVQ